MVKFPLCNKSDVPKSKYDIRFQNLKEILQT